MLRGLVLFAAVFAGPVHAATTIQQDYETAQALLDAGKFAEARNAFSALLSRFSPTSQSRSANVVRARLGNALLATGNPAAAEPLLTTAVASFNAGTPADAEERGIARWDLARAQEAQGKLAEAAGNIRVVLDNQIFPAGSAADIAARATLARTIIWSNPDEARQLLDGLLALPGDKLPKTADQRAMVETLRGRVELNNDKPAEAKRWFAMAARDAGGGATRRVNVADVRIRSDLALANFKLGNMAEVQKYMALSGAGALESEGLSFTVATPLPACAPLTGLAPDAVAIVEFGIGDDGRTTGVTPIYASRGSGAAVPDDAPEILFPNAVRQWFWRLEDVAKLDPFWRQAVRVELRCFNSRVDSLSVDSSFEAETSAWVGSLDIPKLPPFDSNDAIALPAIRAELAAREREYGASSIKLFTVLNALTHNQVAPATERYGANARRQALLDSAKPPLPVRIYMKMNKIEWDAGPIKTYAGTIKFVGDQYTTLLAELVAEGSGDTRTAMYLRHAIAENLERQRKPESRGLFEQIVAAPLSTLPEADPIRISALLHISNQAAAARDMPKAAAALAATGLSPEQCSLIDVRPQARNNFVTGRDFPDEAVRWGTGGMTRVGYDITADGRPVNIRTVVAAPPFVFNATSEKAVAGFRFDPVFRPGNTIGCTGSSQPIRWRVGR